MIQLGKYSFVGSRNQWDITIDKVEDDLVYYRWCPAEGGRAHSLPVSDIESVISSPGVNKVPEFKDYLAQVEL